MTLWTPSMGLCIDNHQAVVVVFVVEQRLVDILDGWAVLLAWQRRGAPWLSPQPLGFGYC